ncbi:PTS sugar transporter subunit IIA [Leptotrichia trevisanii]|uniref:PTS sugar transporter subunit IIA n=1 Tax=Leptotrichia trevisanii TaxID=109328 RepID=UPI0026F1BCC5|nr:PTS sugar transporter subunit IIA [Leptotrichia trevisanii]
MNLLDSLKENNSVVLQQEADSWEDAIKTCMAPLAANNSIEQKYIESIIERTKELGPFYILAPGLAMPHERPEMGVNKSSFSFITLKEPVSFPDGQEVDILIGLAAENAEVHAGEAIPQIVMLFDDEEIFDKIRKAKKPEDIYKLIEEKV